MRCLSAAPEEMTVKTYFISALLCAALGNSSLAWSLCNPALASVTPNSQFTLADSAMVYDTKTGLYWLRCTLGKKWELTSQQCLNDNSQPFFTWSEALVVARNHRHGGFANWRLPNKKELASLLDQSCIAPTINSQIFPDTLEARYWTSTPVSYSDTFYAWFVDFAEGSYGIANGDSAIAVRLVRDAE